MASLARPCITQFISLSKNQHRFLFEANCPRAWKPSAVLPGIRIRTGFYFRVGVLFH
jgi:hypothetical protein